MDLNLYGTVGEKEKTKTVFYQKKTVPGRHEKDGVSLQCQISAEEKAFGDSEHYFWLQGLFAVLLPDNFFNFLLLVIKSYKSVFNALSLIFFTLHQSSKFCLRPVLAFSLRGKNRSCCCTLADLFFIVLFSRSLNLVMSRASLILQLQALPALK